MLLAHDGVDLTYEECIGVTYEEVHADADLALTKIVQKYGAIASQCDAVVIVGSDYTDVASPTELAFNARIAVNLGSPVLLVVRGTDRTPSEIRSEEHTSELQSRGHLVCRLLLVKTKVRTHGM